MKTLMKTLRQKEQFWHLPQCGNSSINKFSVDEIYENFTLMFSKLPAAELLYMGKSRRKIVFLGITIKFGSLNTISVINDKLRKPDKHCVDTFP